MTLKKLSKSNYILLSIIFLGFLLRAAWLSDNLFFGFEQGRDFLRLGEMLKGRLVLIGPQTDADGIFHGALSYYSFLPFFVIFSGNPLYISYTLIFINALAIYFLYKLLKEEVGKRAAFIGSLIYATSYSAVVYARWLLHENLIPALTIFLIYLLFRSKRNPKYLVGVAIVWSVMFHLALQVPIILSIPILIYLYLAKVKLGKKVILYSLLSVLLIMSSYIIFNIRHDGILTSGVTAYLNQLNESAQRASTLDEFKNEIVDNLFPSFRQMAFLIFGLITGILILNSRKNKLARWLLVAIFFAPIIYFVFGFRPLRHFYMYMPVLIAISAAYTFKFIYTKSSLVANVLVILILSSNLFVIFNRLPTSTANFLQAAQRTYYRDELKLIDYVYQQAGGKEFSYDYFSIPYWKIEAWEYLFLWYGKGNYGYLPSPDRTEIFYVLIEPDETQPLYQENWYKGLEKDSTLISSFGSGKLTAEKRKRI